MIEKPHDSILPREVAAKLVAQDYAPQVELLRDLAAYGSNLVIRSFESSPKGIAELIVCGVLLKQVVAMTDATEVLFAAGALHAAHLPARAGWEASVYLDWILAGDSERRAGCYVVGNYRDERYWAMRAIPGTKEEATLTKISMSIGLDLQGSRPELAALAARQVEIVDKLLASANFSSINAEFEKLRGKRRRDPDWYELDGRTSIRDVAAEVSRLAEYEAFYSRGSQVIHTGTYKDHIRIDKDEIAILPIRSLDSARSLMNFIVSVAVGTYMRVLSRYRPGEIGALTKKYTEDWRGSFLRFQ